MEIGDMVQIIYVKFRDAAGIGFDSSKTHPTRIGQIGEVVFYEDDAYNTDRPTGYERAYYTIRFADGQEEDIDTAYCHCMKRKEEKNS
jgi:hypothetical protein